MKSKFLTDDMVEKEIARLNATNEVKLAQKELRLKYKRRQRLYQLRDLEKRGKRLMEAGVTFDNIEEMMREEEAEEQD